MDDLPPSPTGGEHSCALSSGKGWHLVFRSQFRIESKRQKTDREDKKCAMGHGLPERKPAGELHQRVFDGLCRFTWATRH